MKFLFHVTFTLHFSYELEEEKKSKKKKHQVKESKNNENKQAIAFRSFALLT